MPNDYFQFKQFRIEQGHCAMKVSTDACLLGAAADLNGATRLLDIGTGTGLLALMTAQRHPTVDIEAVEIDAAAATQAAANAAASPWAGRIQVHGLSLAEYAARAPLPFSHIICNPPFFRQSLRSPDAARTTARHEAADTLSFETLAAFAARFLQPDGLLTVLLPPLEMQAFERAAAALHWHPATRLQVRHRPGSRPLRHITGFRQGAKQVVETELTIRTASSETDYSPEFRALLSGFYLAL
ncbi:tRNA1(Val) (adenine(37)-N6)-methyltransferase [Hymenobacter properus]|uniref:tRNA1(Val) (adenine(37)-N6)-methyltransferase n=1 Tax=Hymenobacter properus TaxID=2791026 RepID=A0A931BMA7_9BACT|nr:methyltransferase [Hymenobacter properus]MBF9144037.1 methyltransferase [Hymenobacter properus]MBR7722854.1 methyltransferase [Microvirga sp. SRT04]